ncbi:MAG TPA: hypothetical protein VGN21_12465 [Stellaceae bacterium]
MPVFQRLALEIIGGAIFSLDMRQYGPELRELILCYAARLGRPSLIDFLLPRGVPMPSDMAAPAFDGAGGASLTASSPSAPRDRAMDPAISSISSRRRIPTPRRSWLLSGWAIRSRHHRRRA